MNKNFKLYIESIESENLGETKKYRSILNKEAAQMLFDGNILGCLSKKVVCLNAFEFNSKATLIELIYATRSIMCDEALYELLKLIVDHTNRLIMLATTAGRDYLNAYDKLLMRLSGSVSSSSTDASRRAAAKACEHDIGKAQESLLVDVGKDFSSLILKLMNLELIEMHLRECAVSALHAVLLKILNSNKEREKKFKFCTESPKTLVLANGAGIEIKLIPLKDSSKIMSSKFVCS